VTTDTIWGQTQQVLRLNFGNESLVVGHNLGLAQAFQGSPMETGIC
jgi:hypothetical protein